jgi:hypothetical protein
MEAETVCAMMDYNLSYMADHPRRHCIQSPWQLQASHITPAILALHYQGEIYELNEWDGGGDCNSLTGMHTYRPIKYSATIWVV